MTDPIKYMPISAFIDLGFLQEINRLLLHPCGLALAIHTSDHESTTMRVWDYRDDPEGMVFGDGMISQNKIDIVQKIFGEKVESRTAYMGVHVQTAKTKLPSKPKETPHE